MEAGKGKRTFKFHTKVRTGCLTCKTRKVKCDEARPHCKRCATTGRRCDGYEDRRASPSEGSSVQPVAVGTSGLFGSAEEKRSFHYFQSHTSKSLGGCFNLVFWGREVMQAALHDPPIRHLVIALGAAYEDFEAGGSTAGPGTALALQQCNRSIRLLAAVSGQHPSHQSAETTHRLLTASVLFIYLASVRGHIREAIQHVGSAVKVLQDFDQAAEQRAGSPATGGYPVPLAHLRALLVAVYGQLRGMINDTARDVGTCDLLVSNLKPATIFTSVSEAHVYVQTLLHNVLAFNQDAELRPGSTTERLEEIVARHRELCEALESSQNALDVLSTSLRSQEPRDTEAERGLLVLRVYHVLLAMRLRINVLRPEKRESAFDDLEAHLEEMLGYCQLIIEGDRRDGQQQPPLCQSGLGLVMPLHTIVARCRNPRVRRRALHLLLTCSRREGLWDSKIAGRIAAQTLEIEERGDHVEGRVDEGQRVNEDQRVREVKIELQGERGALFRFITVDDWKRGRDGIQKSFQW